MKRTEFTQGWLDALRSGKYKQGYGKLHGSGRYCCLGVAATLCGVNVDDETEGNYELLDSKLGLARHERLSLACENDERLKPFPDIAEMIDAALESE